MLVETDCGSREESYCIGKRLLAREQCLLEIFGWDLCWFEIFGLGSTSVEDIDYPDHSPGEDMPCGYIVRR